MLISSTLWDEKADVLAYTMHKLNPFWFSQCLQRSFSRSCWLVPPPGQKPPQSFCPRPSKCFFCARPLISSFSLCLFCPPLLAVGFGHCHPSFVSLFSAWGWFLLHTASLTYLKGRGKYSVVNIYNIMNLYPTILPAQNLTVYTLFPGLTTHSLDQIRLTQGN